MLHSAHTPAFVVHNCARLHPSWAPPRVQLTGWAPLGSLRHAVEAGLEAVGPLPLRIRPQRSSRHPPLQEDAVEMTANMKAQRHELWASKRLFFCTPDLFKNDLDTGKCPSSRCAHFHTMFYCNIILEHSLHRTGLSQNARLT